MASLLTTGRREEHIGRALLQAHSHAPPTGDPRQGTRKSSSKKIPGRNPKPWHGAHTHAPPGAGGKSLRWLRLGDSEQTSEGLCLQSNLAT